MEKELPPAANDKRHRRNQNQITQSGIPSRLKIALSVSTGKFRGRRAHPPNQRFALDQDERRIAMQAFWPLSRPPSWAYSACGQKEVVHGQKFKLHNDRNESSSSDEGLSTGARYETHLDSCGHCWNHSIDRLGSQGVFLLRASALFRP